MANKAAIDFGNSNTAAAVWNEKTRSADILRIPEYSTNDSFLIPSLIVSAVGIFISIRWIAKSLGPYLFQKGQTPA